MTAVFEPTASRDSRSRQSGRIFMSTIATAALLTDGPRGPQRPSDAVATTLTSWASAAVTGLPKPQDPVCENASSPTSDRRSVCSAWVTYGSHRTARDDGVPRARRHLDTLVRTVHQMPALDERSRVLRWSSVRRRYSRPAAHTMLGRVHWGGVPRARRASASTPASQTKRGRRARRDRRCARAARKGCPLRAARAGGSRVERPRISAS